MTNMLRSQASDTVRQQLNATGILGGLLLGCLYRRRIWLSIYHKGSWTWACVTHIAGCCGHGLHGSGSLYEGSAALESWQAVQTSCLLRIAIFLSKSRGNEGCTTWLLVFCSIV
jgi:hypothetical protein